MRLADDRLIVALDMPSVDSNSELIARLGDAVSFYKVGLGLIARSGFELADRLKSAGHRVFLDMKLFDIGATVQSATAGLCERGFDFLTVHGDPYNVEAAAKGREGTNTRILAVTILTSLDREDLDRALYAEGDLIDLVLERAKRAFSAGADGVIASPQEAKLIRSLPEASGKLIVTPGIRPASTALGDQKRVSTPRQAISDGADHIVVGRPIWQAKDPAAAANEIVHDFADP